MSLGQDIYEVQNPALAGVLQWRFAVGYTGSRADAAGPPLQTVYLIAPLLLDDEIRSVLQGTQRRSGLRQFAEKFAQSSGSGADILASIHERVAEYRPLSTRGLQMGIQGGLFSVDARGGTVIALTKSRPRLTRAPLTRFMTISEKLGHWMSDMTLFEISRTLGVRF